jgi:aminopeptidase
MRDPRVAKLADLLVNYSNEIKPGDWCLIQGEMIVKPLARELHRAVLEAGGNPSSWLFDGELPLITVEYANEEQLDFASPISKLIMEQADALFTIFGTVNTRMRSNADPARLARTQQANKEAIETYFKRIGSGDLRFVISRFPTQASAQEGEMSLTEYEDFIFKACLLDEEDPIAAWNGVHEKQQRIVDWLKGRKALKVEASGVELTMSIDGRSFINSDGKNNMPSGEVFTSPVEDSVEGRIAFSYPTILGGREVDGVELEFEQGRVVKAKAGKGEDYLLSQIDQDEGGRRLGEFAIGTNYAIDRFTGDTLFDEKIGGTMHVALGRGIPEAGGSNESIIHWDMVTDIKQGSRISADGDVFYEDGEFLI